MANNLKVITFLIRLSIWTQERKTFEKEFIRKKLSSKCQCLIRSPIKRIECDLIVCLSVVHHIFLMKRRDPEINGVPRCLLWPGRRSFPIAIAPSPSTNINWIINRRQFRDASVFLFIFFYGKVLQSN